MTRTAATLGTLAAFATGCTTFATVRSAEVRPGFQGVVQAAGTPGPVGDVAGWFWGLDCTGPCNHPVGGADVNAAYGWRPRTGRPFTIGGGVNGLIYPYVEGYVELAKIGRVPLGAGGRFGLPGIDQHWSEHALYARADVPLSPTVRLLYNPGLVWHMGSSPNNQTKGSFRGIVHGAGLEFDQGRLSIIPSAGWVFGRAEHGSGSLHVGPESHGFGWIALGVDMHRPRRR